MIAISATLVIALVFTFLFIHPYITYPLSLRLLPAKPIDFRGPSLEPSATLVFCAYNEAESLPDKLRNLRELAAVAPALKFACYLDFSSDTSRELLDQSGDLVSVTHATERTGKALGMRHLVANCDTDIVIFTDANVTLEPKSLKGLFRYFQDPGVGVVCGTLHYTNGEESETAAVNSAYWRLEETIKRLESRSGSLVGADGSIFAMRRSLYTKVPAHLLDDFISSMSVLISGYRVVSAPDVRAFEKTATASSDEFRRKRRIACRAYSSHRYLLPQLGQLDLLHRYKYVSHRVVRWYGALAGAGASLAYLVVSLLAFGPAVTAAAIALGSGFIWIGAKRGWPFVGLGVEIARSIFAAGLGVSDALRGRTYQTWTQAASR